jgi:hypothetical protein
MTSAPHSSFYGSAGQAYFEASLVDILSKRDIAYQYFLRSKFNSLDIPHSAFIPSTLKLLTELEPLFNNMDFVLQKPEVVSSKLAVKPTLDTDSDDYVTPLSYLNLQSLLSVT